MIKNKTKSWDHELQLRQYAKKTFERYQSLSRKEKKIFLDQVILDFGGHRKAIIRLYNRLIHRIEVIKHPALLIPEQGRTVIPLEKRGRKKIYFEDDLIWWLQTLWVNMNFVSERLMHSMMKPWLDKCEDDSLPENIKQKLLKLSPSSIERILRNYKKHQHKKIFSTTKRSKNKELMIKIPCRQIGFKAPSVGFIEGDTVAHCGNSLSGAFAWTLNTVDHKTAWTEQEAFIANTAANVVDATIAIRKRYPFAIKGFHSDGGSEFINSLLYDYLSDAKNFTLQTHGRAYKKNDQARIEQRNWTCVRQLFGYQRIAHQELVDKMNDIYSNEWSLLNNFFTATRKQTHKVRIGSKFKRTFDTPKTPHQRTLDQKDVSDFEKTKLNKIYESLNPFQLKKSLDRKLKEFDTLIKELDIVSDEKNKEAA